MLQPKLAGWSAFFPWIFQGAFAASPTALPDWGRSPPFTLPAWCLLSDLGTHLLDFFHNMICKTSELSSFLVQRPVSELTELSKQDRFVLVFVVVGLS